MNRVKPIVNHSSLIESVTVSEEHRIAIPSPTPPPATPKVLQTNEGKK